jgi:hypothetical protein
MANDAMFKLEHTSDDVKKAANVQMSVGQLENRRSDYKDDYILNKLARSKFRVRNSVYNTGMITSLTSSLGVNSGYVTLYTIPGVNSGYVTLYNTGTITSLTNSPGVNSGYVTLYTIPRVNSG